MDEIKELDNKYLVLKWDDIAKYVTPSMAGDIVYISRRVSEQRKADGEKDNQYVVLNLDDEIDIDYLFSKLQKFKKIGRDDYYSQVKMDRVAIDLVNAILKTKQERD